MSCRASFGIRKYQSRAREVPTPVGFVVVDQVAKGAAGPCLRGSIVHPRVRGRGVVSQYSEKLSSTSSLVGDCLGSLPYRPYFCSGTVNSTSLVAPGNGLCVASANSRRTVCGPGFNPTSTTVSPLVSTIGHD